VRRAKLNLLITISFPSPLKTIGWLFGTPLSIETYTIFSFCNVFLPLHPLHLAPSAIISPSPLQVSHYFCTCWYIPGPIWYIWTTLPFPLHVTHDLTLSPPFPLHFSQHLTLSWVTLIIPPLYMFSKVTYNAFFVGLHFGIYFFWLGRCPPPPLLKNMSKMSKWIDNYLRFLLVGL
jgi:hypothetical protein